jgi:trans-AT polyketide synthase/acyltransferase/oxidoreductase domain-containing protein
MKVIFMFSGQGSQYYQMGKKLFDTNAVFREKMLELDEISKAVQGESVVGALYAAGKKLFDPCTTLHHTHPAIFMVEIALARVLIREGLQPDHLVGFSLGEFTAAVLSGALTERAALEMIIQQAQLVRDRCVEGGLIAVLQHPDLYHQTPVIRNNSALASINGPAQFAIAGEKGAMDTIKQFLKEKDILHQELMVGYGFHSPAIDAAQAAYTRYLSTQTIGLPTVPVLSGLTGQPVQAFAPGYFWDIVRQPTNYVEAIQTVENTLGREHPLMYIDLGPAGSLANLVKYNMREGSTSRGFQVMSPFQQELKKLEEVISYHRANQPVAPAVQTAKKDKLVAWLFPGQGSQKKGMGEHLFPAFPELTDKASDLLGYSIKELCLDPANRNLNLTQYTQPALYVVNALAYLQLKEEAGEVPDFVAGHSLGEYNALFAAGALDFETGLRLVQKRGALMAMMKDGGMAAVKGLSEEAIKDVLQQHGLDEIDVANYNSQNQIVLSGPKELINRSGHYFEAAGASLYFVLNVSGAFHSRYMLPARQEFELFLQQFQFAAPKIPVVSNVEAALYRQDKIRSLLADQLIKPVRWTDSVLFLSNQGSITFKEVGPGDVLTKLVFGIQRDRVAPAPLGAAAL